MRSIGLIAPIPHDGTSFYRAVGPFSYLQRETGIRVVTSDGWGWVDMMPLDAMVLQRPFTDEHVQVATMCKGLNLPLWVDYDDLYSGFPAYIPVQQNTYGSKRALANMAKCLELADIVTVSTAELGRQFGVTCSVIPNALNTYIWPLPETEPKERAKVISWRGSGGHLGDLDPVLEDLHLIRDEFPDWSFHFLGQPHYKCEEIGTIHPTCDLVFEYMQNFAALKPAIHIVPLADNIFNRCKSNIAWLEASAAGAVTVAPNWEEWQKPGVINYLQGPYGLYIALKAAIESAERLKMLKESRDYIRTHLRLSVVNNMRAEILAGL